MNASPAPGSASQAVMQIVPVLLIVLAFFPPRKEFVGAGKDESNLWLVLVELRGTLDEF